MDASAQLAEFLQARRARLRPEDVGLATYGERRRVPGLRREELALLAGVSTSYYVRLEQGQSPNASPEVIDALARALRLDPGEHEHLRVLARAKRERVRQRPRPAVERVAPQTMELLEALGDMPALVLGRRTDVLACNPLGYALLLPHLDPGAKPNMAKQVFLNEHVRALYSNWRAKAEAVVGNLRLVAGQYPDDPLLSGLIGELTTRSGQFARMWADHKVRSCGIGQYDLRHPVVGPLTVNQQTLLLAHARDQSLVVYTPEPDSSALARLQARVRSTMPDLS